MRLIRSFGYALRGIGQSTRDRNMRIHILATVVVADSAQLPYPDERIKHIKDIAAGAVLVVAIGAAITGGIVFFPFIWG